MAAKRKRRDVSTPVVSTDITFKNSLSPRVCAHLVEQFTHHILFHRQFLPCPVPSFVDSCGHGNTASGRFDFHSVQRLELEQPSGFATPLEASSLSVSPVAGLPSLPRLANASGSATPLSQRLEDKKDNEAQRHATLAPVLPVMGQQSAPRVPGSLQQLRQHKISRRVGQAVDVIRSLSEAFDQLFQTCCVRKIVFVVGSSLYNPRELYTVHLAYDSADIPGPALSMQLRHRYSQKLVRELVSSSCMPTSDPGSLQKLHIAVQVASFQSSPSLARHFKPNRGLSISVRKSTLLSSHLFVGRTDEVELMRESWQEQQQQQRQEQEQPKQKQQMCRDGDAALDDHLEILTVLPPLPALGRDVGSICDSAETLSTQCWYQCNHVLSALKAPK